jgi:hypothetical protein
MKSIKNGSWFDPTVWDTGRVPLVADDCIVEHHLTADKSIIIENRLYCRNGGIAFINVDMTKFRGGGHSPYDVPAGSTTPLHVTDVGLWVTGAGQLDLRGSVKTGWVTLTHGMPAGATKFTHALVGWEVGDSIAISPNIYDAWEFTETTIKAVNGNDYTIDPLPRSHDKITNPRSGNTFYPQVINLSRNQVYIKGTATGQSHVLISSTKPQFIEYVLFQHMGPRKEQRGSDDRPEFVLGRYPIHFHHALDGSRGSKITGNVCIDCPSHCYVPHGSNGIYFFDNISYRTLQTPYWTDLGHAYHDTTFDHNFAGDASYIVGSKNMDMEDPAFPNDTPPTIAVHGFEVGLGTGLVMINNCVSGIRYGDVKTGGAYNWEANNELDAWIFKDNIAHNNFCNLRNWQNTRTHHLIEGFIGYNALPYIEDNDGSTQRMNIFNGAYTNPYRYIGCECFNGMVDAKAASSIYDTSPDGYGQVWDRNIFDMFYLGASPLPSEVPIQLWRSKVGAILNDSGVASDGSGLAPHNLDVVESTFDSISFGPLSGPTETMRVQNGNTAYKITKDGGKVTIPKFNFDVVVTPTPVSYSNVQKSQVYSCPTGTTGTPYTYIVPAGKYTSIVSQADADAKADNDIFVNGQTVASANLVCTPIVINPTVTAVFKAYLDITIDMPASYIITNYYNNITPYRKGTLVSGMNRVDISTVTQDTIYLWVNGVRKQKIMK